MGERRSQGQDPGSLVDRRRLDDGQLVFAQRLADEFQATGKGARSGTCVPAPPGWPDARSQSAISPGR
jgi:hypothetical protein